MKSRKVILASNRALLRLGCRALLGGCADFQIAAESTHSRQLLKHLEQQEADLLIVELEDESYLTIELVRHCRKVRPSLPVLLLEGCESRLDRETMDRLRPDGYLSRHSRKEDFLEACRAVSDGRPWRNGQPGEPPPVPGHLACLTPRERVVAAEISAGRTNVQIAERLLLSVHTVQACVSGMLRKLHKDNRTHLVTMLAARPAH